jgi:hypothetical protein
VGQVIELCRSCGFEIPADARGCKACAPAPPPPRAARQAAALALPTRSVHALPATPARPEPPRPLGRARAARSAFSFTTALVLLTFGAAGLAWVAEQPRFVLAIPDGTSDALDHLTTLAAQASVAGLLAGLAASAVWCVRAVAHAVRVRRAA